MNTLKLFLAALCSILVIAGSTGAQEVYDYPLEDAYAATIIGTPNALKASFPKEINVNNLKMTVFPDRKIPEVFWYQDKLRYSLAYQKKEAPLIFIIAGTGARYNSSKMKMLQSAFWGAGFHVICLSSPTHPNFMANASTSKMPGNSTDDAIDLYRVMDLAWQAARTKIKVTDFYLTGYSLGAAESAFVSKLDEEKGLFNFKKVLMINPPVSLYNSVIILDNMLENNIPGGPDHFNEYFEKAMTRFSSFYQSHGALDFNDDFLYAMYNENNPSEKGMAALIGLSFRISSSNMLFTADVLNNFGYIVPKNLKLSRTDSLTEYHKVTGRQSFVDYIDNLLIPHLSASNPGLTKEHLISGTSLTAIEDYLKTTKKIGLVTNIDDLILKQGEVDYLKQIFQARAKIYPKGGHCGNMDHKENVAYMIDFFSN
jgi:predicted alpha/beta-fold hydrolase